MTVRSPAGYSDRHETGDMTHRHPFSGRLAWCFTLMLVWLMAEPGYASQHAPSPHELREQAFEKIVEARGRARARHYLDALNQLDDAVSLAERMEDRLPLALALHNIAEIQLLRGAPRDALNAYYQVLGIYTALGHESGVGLVQRRIRTLSRLLSRAEKPPASEVKPVAPSEAQDRLSLVDQAVERVRQRIRSRGQDGRSVAPSGPTQVTRAEPPTTVDTPARELTSKLSQGRSAAIRDIPNTPSERVKREPSTWSSPSRKTVMSKTSSC